MQAPANTQRSVRVRHWSHVILYVADMNASLAFYRDFLGGEIFSDDPIGGPDFERMVGVEGARSRILNLVLGGQKVELIELQGLPMGPPAQRSGRGLAGFTLRVEDIEEAYQLCQDRGIPCETPPTEIHGFRQFAIVDPDGAHIELSEPPEGLERFGPFSAPR